MTLNVLNKIPLIFILLEFFIVNGYWILSANAFSVFIYGFIILLIWYFMLTVMLNFSCMPMINPLGQDVWYFWWIAVFYLLVFHGNLCICIHQCFLNFILHLLHISQMQPLNALIWHNVMIGYFYIFSIYGIF